MRVKHGLKRLLASLLCAAMVLRCTPITAFATDSTEAASNATSDTQSGQEATESEPEDAIQTPESADSSNSEESGTTPEYSAEVQAFLDAVNALDKDSILSASNGWGLANKAWLENPDDAELTAALDAATSQLDEVQYAFVQCEDLYFALSSEEQEIDAVSEAYATYSSIYTMAMNATMSPTEPSDGEATPETSDDEIAAHLYSDLPDEPTGYYIGSYGLPVATGDTKVSISGWNEELMSDNAGRFDVNALNAGSSTINVSLVEGKDYAIVPIMVQVEYPDNNSTATVSLPDGVEVVNPASTVDSPEIVDDETRNDMLSSTFVESSSGIFGFYVKASEDFIATVTYSGNDGKTIEQTASVVIGDKADDGLQSMLTDAELAMRPSPMAVDVPAPSELTGKITHVQKVNGTWLIWFNGQPAYCCNYGKQGKPDGCPPYSYAYASTVDQDYGDHYTNQVTIWGGLGQMSVFSASASSYSLTDEQSAYDTFYNEDQQWVIENYPDSVAAQIYVQSANEAVYGGVSTYAGGDTSKIVTYIYTCANPNWQTIAVMGPVVTVGDEDVMDEDGKKVIGTARVVSTWYANATSMTKFYITASSGSPYGFILTPEGEGLLTDVVYDFPVRNVTSDSGDDLSSYATEAISTPISTSSKGNLESNSSWYSFTFPRFPDIKDPHFYLNTDFGTFASTTIVSEKNKGVTGIVIADFSDDEIAQLNQYAAQAIISAVQAIQNGESDEVIASYLAVSDIVEDLAGSSEKKDEEMLAGVSLITGAEVQRNELTSGIIPVEYNYHLVGSNTVSMNANIRFLLSSGGECRRCATILLRKIGDNWSVVATNNNFLDNINSLDPEW